MSSGTSYNGWPANSDPNAIGINYRFGDSVGAPPFGSGGYVGGMKSGDVSTVFAYLINRLYEIEPVPAGEQPGYGCWGYSYRANVNNPSTLSCHASGTAIDWRAPWHPNGTSTGPNGGGGWSGDQYRAIRAVLDGPLQGCISWLTSNDPMHFEIKGNAAKVASVAASLGGSTPPPQTGDWFDMATEADLARIVGEQIDARLGSIGIAVWTTPINERGAANAMINQASAMAQAAADGVRDVPTNVWIKSITGDGPGQHANELLAQAAAGGPAAPMSAPAAVPASPAEAPPAPEVSAPEVE
jgi:hypothetical protein